MTLSMFTKKNPLKKVFANSFNTAIPPRLPIDRTQTLPLKALCDYITQPHHRYLLVVDECRTARSIIEFIKQSQLTLNNNRHGTTFKRQQPHSNHHRLLGLGAELPDAKLSIIVEAQLFGDQLIKSRNKREKSIDPDLIIRDLSELQIGSPVVHLQFGVGRYQGLQSIENNGCLNDYLVLSYAGNDKIYVPITALNVISRYTGADNEHAPLHKLGSDQWQKEKKKAIEKIHDVAIELLEIYAKREAKPGHVYDIDLVEYQRFASVFHLMKQKINKKPLQTLCMICNPQNPWID